LWPTTAKEAVLARLLGGTPIVLYYLHSHAPTFSRRCTTAVIHAHPLSMHPPLLHNNWRNRSSMYGMQCMCAVHMCDYGHLKCCDARLTGMVVKLGPSSSSDTAPAAQGHFAQKMQTARYIITRTGSLQHADFAKIVQKPDRSKCQDYLTISMVGARQPVIRIEPRCSPSHAEVTFTGIIRLFRCSKPQNVMRCGGTALQYVDQC